MKANIYAINESGHGKIIKKNWRGGYIKTDKIYRVITLKLYYFL